MRSAQSLGVPSKHQACRVQLYAEKLQALCRGSHGVQRASFGRRGIVSTLAAAQSHSTSAPSALTISRQIAAARLVETQRSSPLLMDPYAEALAKPLAEEAAAGALDDKETAKHIIASKYIDECLLNAMAATAINRINKGDYRQVVLLGDGLDTRPFRLPWPSGTVLFMVAPLESHEAAQAVLRAAPEPAPRPPPGTLLRRISADLRSGADFSAKLQAAGFRADRLSVWGLQGLAGVEDEALTAALVNIANLASYHSLVIGELPQMSQRQANCILADAGLLGSTYAFSHELVSCGRWQEDWGTSSQPTGQQGTSLGGSLSMQSVSIEEEERWVFAAQQQHLSLAEMEAYEVHKSSAEELDEDFHGNFS